MAEVAHVLVVLRRTGKGEGVVTADRVADDLDQRNLVLVVELPEQAGLGVGVAHQRARGRRVETAFLPCLQLVCVEGEEVGALPAPDVDHLDVLARLDLVGERGCASDLEIEAWLGERIRERRVDLLAWFRAPDLDAQVGGRGAPFHHRHPCRCGDRDDGRPGGFECLLGPCR